jgi:hypothetical protein
MTNDERKTRNTLSRSAVQLDRLSEEYAAAGDDYNARHTASEADALWAQAQEITRRARLRDR